MARRKGIQYNPLEQTDVEPDPFGMLPPPSQREQILTVMSALGQRNPDLSFGELVELVKAKMGEGEGDAAFLDAAKALLSR
jgi:hypothetical protein